MQNLQQLAAGIQKGPPLAPYRLLSRSRQHQMIVDDDSKKNIFNLDDDDQVYKFRYISPLVDSHFEIEAATPQ